MNLFDEHRTRTKIELLYFCIVLRQRVARHKKLSVCQRSDYIPSSIVSHLVTTLEWLNFFSYQFQWYSEFETADVFWGKGQKIPFWSILDSDQVQMYDLPHYFQRRTNPCYCDITHDHETPSSRDPHTKLHLDSMGEFFAEN